MHDSSDFFSRFYFASGILFSALDCVSLCVFVSVLFIVVMSTLHLIFVVSFCYNTTVNLCLSNKLKKDLCVLVLNIILPLRFFSIYFTHQHTGMPVFNDF